MCTYTWCNLNNLYVKLFFYTFIPFSERAIVIIAHCLRVGRLKHVKCNYNARSSLALHWPRIDFELVKRENRVPSHEIYARPEKLTLISSVRSTKTHLRARKYKNINKTKTTKNKLINRRIRIWETLLPCIRTEHVLTLAPMMVALFTKYVFAAL